MTTIFSLLLSEEELLTCILEFGDGLMVSHSRVRTLAVKPIWYAESFMGFSPQKGFTGVFYTNADWIGLALNPLHKTKKWLALSWTWWCYHLVTHKPRWSLSGDAINRMPSEIWIELLNEEFSLLNRKSERKNI